MKMPEPIELSSPLAERAVWGHSTKQMKQYGRDLLEEAAKECAEIERKTTRQPPMVGQGCQACAAAIRKLKETL